MATLAHRGAGTPTTSGTTWTTTTNAVDGAIPANPATYAVWTSTTSGAVGYIEVSGYVFTSIPDTATLNSVTVALRHFENNITRIATVTFQAYAGATPLGSAASATLSLSARSDSATFPVTLAQLKAGTFKVRATATRAAVTQSATFNVDQIDVTADYTPLGSSVGLAPATMTVTANALGLTVAAGYDPADLIVTPTSSTTADLSWDAAVAAGVTDYTIYRRTPPTAVPFVPGTDTPHASTVAALTYPATGLTASTAYEWQAFGRVPEAGGWTPADLPGLVAWFDASDAATITVSAGAVSQWSDKSGGAHHLTQATSSIQPTTGTRTINSLNVIDFARAVGPHSMTFASHPCPGATAATVLYVFQRNTDPPSPNDTYSAGVLQGFNTADDPNTFEPYTDGTIYDPWGSTVRKSFARVGNYATNPVLVSKISAPADWRYYTASTLRYSTATNTVAFDGSTPRVALAMSGSHWFDGRIAEIIVCTGALSDTDRGLAETYLRDKWATP